MFFVREKDVAILSCCNNARPGLAAGRRWSARIDTLTSCQHKLRTDPDKRVVRPV